MSACMPVNAGFRITNMTWVGLLLLSCCLFPVAAFAAGMSGTANDGMQGDPSSGIGKRQRDALGNLCLQISPLARPQAVNPNIYDQVLVIRNQCNRTIKIRACYSDSGHCVENEIPALTRRDMILGVSPMIRFFRYDVREL